MPPQNLTASGFPIAPTEAERHQQMALHRTAAGGDHEALAQRINEGADPTFADATGRTVLHAAAGALRPENVGVLLPLSNLEAVDTSGRSALFSAVTAASAAPANPAGPRTVEALLDAGADINEPDTDGFTVLMACAYYSEGAAELCRVLIERGANVRQIDRDGATALHWAANKPHPKQAELIRALVEAGCPVNHPNETDGQTALHQAVRWECPLSMIDALLAAGADPLRTDFEGRSPAGLASDQGSESPAHRRLSEAVAALPGRSGSGPVNGVR